MKLTHSQRPAPRLHPPTRPGFPFRDSSRATRSHGYSSARSGNLITLEGAAVSSFVHQPTLLKRLACRGWSVALFPLRLLTLIRDGPLLDALRAPRSRFRARYLRWHRRGDIVRKTTTPRQLYGWIIHDCTVSFFGSSNLSHALCVITVLCRMYISGIRHERIFPLVI